MNASKTIYTRPTLVRRDALRAVVAVSKSISGVTKADT